VRFIVAGDKIIAIEAFLIAVLRNDAKGSRCCYSTAITIKRTGHNVTLYVHCLSSQTSRVTGIRFECHRNTFCAFPLSHWGIFL